MDSARSQISSHDSWSFTIPSSSKTWSRLLVRKSSPTGNRLSSAENKSAAAPSGLINSCGLARWTPSTEDRIQEFSLTSGVISFRPFKIRSKQKHTMGSLSSCGNLVIFGKKNSFRKFSSVSVRRVRVSSSPDFAKLEQISSVRSNTFTSK